MTTAASTQLVDPAPRPGLTPGAVAGLAVALAAVAAGALVSTDIWFELFGVADSTRELVQGAALFRVALVACGAYALVGIRLHLWSGGAPARPHRAPSTDGVTRLAVLLVIAAAILRLVRLDGGMWVDEVTTLVNYAREPFGRIFTTYDSQNQHMLYSLLAHASFQLFGESAWALRLPAALFGVGGVWALYLLGCEVASRREAILATTILTFSYQHIWASQSARGYSGLFFFSVLSSWVLLRAMRLGARRLWAIYAVVTALGMFVHQTMTFVVAAQFVVYLGRLAAGTARGPEGPQLRSVSGDGQAERQPRHTFALSGYAPWVPFWSGFVPAGLLTIALYAIVLPQFPETAATDTSPVQTWRNPLWTLQEIAAGLHLGPMLAIALVAGAVVVGFGIYSYLRTAPAVPALLILSAGAGTAAMVVAQHHIWPRFYFFAVGFAILVVVRGLLELGGLASRLLHGDSRWTMAVATALTLLAVAAGLPSMRYVYAPKQDFAGARDFVNASRGADDAVVTVGVASDPYRRYFEPSWQVANTAADVNALGSGKPRTWLVYTLPIEMASEHPDVLDLVQRSFTPVRQFGGTLGGGEIYVYVRDMR